MLSVEREEITRASRVLGKAFFDDPIWRGFVPDEDERERFLPSMFEFILRCGDKYGHVWKSSDRMEGVAIWFPAKTADLGFLLILFGGLFGKAMKLMSQYKRIMRDMQKNMSVLEKDRNRFMKGRDHLYLMAIGVAPEYRSQGHGGTLLKQLFGESHTREVPVYLETETEENVRLYEHHGFETIGERDFAHKGFHIWQMVRRPERSS
ncbi:MAG: GNAT family N-acetyltransferase [Spirochaetales bacterium]|nr:GNAT family N-acetyltransferase [Spirochaetales bacterium]